ncbi:MAG: trimethylamine methyltransferase family protein, partial [Chloroflexota bacterium]
RDGGMRYAASFLGEAERAQVHETSLRILAGTGVRFHGERALPLLTGAGVRVDAERGVAWIPPALVEAALASAPGSFVLGARNPEHACPLPSPVTRYGMDGTAAFTLDAETGERRYGTRADIEQALRVFSATEMGVLAWPPVAASDTPAPSRALHEWGSMIRATSLHGQHELHRRDQAPYLAALLTAVAGSAEALRTDHPFSLIYCPVAPLVHDGPMLDAYLDLGDLDLPVMVMPMPVTGTTGPAGLFGNVALANAEALSAIVVFQLAHPGRPVVYSSATGSMDFRSGAFLGGTPEMGLMSGALVTMGRFYGLPATAAGCTSDAHKPGPEAVLEKLVTMLPPASAGADIVVGFGEIEGDQLLVLEQILVDDELARLCQRLVEGIGEPTDPDIAAQVAEVGPGGTFLASPITRRAARSREFLVPALIGRHGSEAWRGLGSPTMYGRAREKVREILAGPVTDPLPDGTAAELDRILAEADRALA